MRFRFGVALWQARGRAEWVATARKAETLGYDIVTMPDHLTDRLAPMPAMISAAEATTRLRVGTNVLNNDLRHPVLVAREAATVDLLTEGRLQLGLGAGSIRAEYDQIGLAFDRGAERVERLGEAVSIIKSLLAGETVNFTGKYYRVTAHALEFRPVQKPRPPILIGGNGPRLLALAAQEADIVGFSGINFRNGGAQPPDLSSWRAGAVDERVRLVRAIAQPELNVLVQQVVVTENRRAAAEELTRRWPQLAGDDVLESPYVLIGTVGQIAEQILARRERWGFSNYTVHEPCMDDFAPVLARLAEA
jgi:probable F420-dependent oxidoreductase